MDLKTRIDGLDTRLTHDESELHVLAQSLAGSDVLASESSLSSWLTTHARDMILDTAFKSSKFHKIKVTAAEWVSDWCLPNYFLVHPEGGSRSTGRAFDWYWSLGAGKDLTMRSVFARKFLDPTHLPWVPGVMPWGSGDHYRISMDHIYYCDQEMRGEASILLGKAGAPHEASFRVKSVTSYSEYTTSTFGADDPVHVLATTPLLIMDTQAANFYVPINTPAISIGGVLLDPNALGDTNHHAHHHYHNKHHSHQHITRKHLHSHTHLNDYTSMTYVSPSVTKNFHMVTHQTQTCFESTYRHTTHKLYKTVKVVPSFFHTEFHMTVPPRTVSWSKITNLPDFSAFYAGLNHNHDTQYAALGHHHDDRYYTKTQTDAQNANQYTTGEVDGLLAGRAVANHNHDSRYVTQASLSGQIASLVDVGGLANVLDDYDVVDHILLRHVSTDMLIFTVRHKDIHGQTVDTMVPTYDIYSASLANLNYSITALDQRLTSV